MAREIVGARELGEVGRETRPAAFAGFADDGYEVLRRAVEIELKLAMLIDRAKRRDRRSPLAVLAQALAPKLHVPGGEASQTVGIGKHDGSAHAPLFGETNNDCGAERGSALPRALRVKHRGDDGSRPFAQGLDIEAAR